MKFPNDLITQVIHRSGCVIQVMGKRSTKGWEILRRKGETLIPQGDRPSKAEAIQHAEDACEPGVAATFVVRPKLTT